MKVAIISVFHPESSLCLAKYLGKQDCVVDYFYLDPDMKNYTSAFEYPNAPKRLGIIKLTKKHTNLFSEFITNISVNIFLIRLLSVSPKFKWLNKILLFLCCKKIKKAQYDVINIVGQYYPLVNYLHNFLKKENLVHTIHEVTSHYLQQKSNTDLTSILIKEKNKVILHSETSLKRYTSLPGYEKLTAKHIPFGKFESYLLYDTDTDMNLKIYSKHIFLYYGFIRPYKGLDVLVDALKIMPENCDFQLIIAGSGYDDSLVYFNNDMRVTVINRMLSNQEIVYLNKMATCIVCPYKSASQSGIVSTSFVFGKPIIASNVGAFKETIQNEINGLLCEPNLPEQLMNAMQRVINENNLYEKLCKGVKQFGENDIYDWNNIALQTIEFYKA